MFFEKEESILYSDTPVSDIFLSEYLPSMECECIKVYLYCLFLSKHRKRISVSELSKKLGFEHDVITGAFQQLEAVGVVRRKDGKIVLEDLKQKEVNKIYRMKTTSTPEEAAMSSERNKRRNQTIAAINNTFFQGVMSPSWYTDLDAWFDKYGFEEDVMYALFQHCYDHKALSKSYITKVADNWHSKGIKNSFDLDEYFLKYKKCKDLKGQIIKKLKLARNLTEYEDEYIEKWSLEYGYGFDVVEIALKKTTAKTHPNFKYIDSIITNWHKGGLTTKQDVIEYEKKWQMTSFKKTERPAVPQKTNFKQREYDNELYERFFDNSDKMGAGK